MGKINGATPLSAARKKFYAALDGGGMVCPCCDRHGKRARRPLHRRNAEVLLYLVREQGWVNMTDAANVPKQILAHGRDYTVMKHWGLIERHAKHVGVWRATQAGIDFAHGRTRVQERALTYKDECAGFAGRLVTISQVLERTPTQEELIRGE